MAIKKKPNIDIPPEDIPQDVPPEIVNEVLDEIVSEEDEKILTLKQTLFCHYYVMNEETRGNATLSYALAYWWDIDWASRDNEKDDNGREILGTSQYDKMIKLIAPSASRNTRKVKIQETITRLWNTLLTDEQVDAKHAQILFKGRDDVALRAVQEYNRIKWRITDKTKDESESDKAKADLFKTLEWQVKTMSKEELSGTIQDLLTPKR